jgi:hypothetical protein
MRTAIAMAAAMAVGGTTAAAGATGLLVPAKWYGSDTCQVITWDMLGGQLIGYTGAGDTDLASGQSAQYLAGGSGAGQAAMASSVALSAATEQAAPMSKLMTNGICGTSSAPILGIQNGTSAQNASGIVIAMDAVSLYASVTSGASTACTTPGSAGDGQTTDGLVSSGSSTSVFPGGTTGQNWKWALALLYGGYDLSQPTVLPDCNSTQRQYLVAHWSQLFQNGCTNANTVCSNSTHTALGQSGSVPLWHAFRRDDASGTSDVFSNVIGIQSKMPSPSASGNHGFGASPFCNALNWDSSTANASCSLNTATDINDQFVGPGGIVDPNSQCIFTSFSNTTETCGAAGTGNHRRPPPGAYGDAPVSSVGADVLPTSFQDNDPIRRPCLGNTTGNQFKSGEEVCNTDNKLGVVLSIPASDWTTRTQVNGVQLIQYSTNACNSFAISAPPRIFNCAIANSGVHGGECPNGDSQFAGGCLAPVDTVNNTSMCLNPRGNYTVLVTRTSLQPSYDARRHNLFMLDGDMAATIQPMKETLPNGTASPPNVDFFAGMGRIHSTQSIWDTTTNTTPPNIGCQMKDETDQIACLAQADPCSIGYAGDGGKTWYSNRGPSDGDTANLCAALTSGGATTLPPACTPSNPLVSDSIRVDGTYPTTDNVQALGSQHLEYQISRKLYYNSIGGFANITSTTADPGGAGELDFGAWESIATNTQPIIASIGYFQLSPTQAPNGNETSEAGVGYTKPFCEDFNQNMLCGDHPTNDNACNRNGGTAVTVPGYPTTASAALGYATALPGDPSSNPALSTTSTVCGNGVQEAYEECDDGANNGASGDKCNNICRCAGTLSYKQGPVDGGTAWGCF